VSSSPNGVGVRREFAVQDQLVKVVVVFAETTQRAFLRIPGGTGGNSVYIVNTVPVASPPGGVERWALYRRVDHVEHRRVGQGDMRAGRA